jgi:hypothetical protein
LTAGEGPPLALARPAVATAVEDALERVEAVGGRREDGDCGHAETVLAATDTLSVVEIINS